MCDAPPPEGEVHVLPRMIVDREHFFFHQGLVEAVNHFSIIAGSARSSC